MGVMTGDVSVYSYITTLMRVLISLLIAEMPAYRSDHAIYVGHVNYVCHKSDSV